MTVSEFVRNMHPVVSMTLAVGSVISVGGVLCGCIMAGDDANSQAKRTNGVALICLSANFIFGAALLMSNVVRNQNFNLTKNSVLLSAIGAAVSPIFLPLVTYPEAVVYAIVGGTVAFCASCS